MPFFRNSMGLYRKMSQDPYAGLPGRNPYLNRTDGYQSDAYYSRNNPPHTAPSVAANRRTASPPPPRARHESLPSMTSHPPIASSSSSSSTAPLKSILKSSKKAEKESVPQPSKRADYDIANPRRTAPADHNSVRRSSHDGFQQPTLPQPTRPAHNSIPLPKSVYVPPPSGMPAFRLKVPLKSEQISLTWPLLRNTNYKFRHQPRAVARFDVGIRPPRGIYVFARDARGNLLRDQLGQWVMCPCDVSTIPASTHCTLTEMVIFTDHIPGWTASVRNKDGITCLDVFIAIYEALHLRLGHDEMLYINELSLAMRQKFWGEFQQRCLDYGISESTAPRKVDILMGQRIFDGLVQVGDHWKLNFTV